MTARHPIRLETLTLGGLSETAAAAYEAALAHVCASVALVREEPGELWQVEGVKEAGADEPELAAALALAAAASGITALPARAATAADGWLARTEESFPEQFIGKRFAIRGSHLHGPLAAGRITLHLDAGLAFGSGEHGSTRGCLRALEALAWRRPRRILDLGTGSGILAMAAASLLHRKVLASDIEPWSVLVAAGNAKRNGLAGQLRIFRADGWHDRRLGAGAPYDLVFANILARPLCAMARDLGDHLAPGGHAILAGLLGNQVRMVLAAHRRQGLVLRARLSGGPGLAGNSWTTLVLHRPIKGQ